MHAHYDIQQAFSGSKILSKKLSNREFQTALAGAGVTVKKYSRKLVLPSTYFSGYKYSRGYFFPGK